MTVGNSGSSARLGRPSSKSPAPRRQGPLRKSYTAPAIDAVIHVEPFGGSLARKLVLKRFRGVVDIFEVADERRGYKNSLSVLKRRIAEGLRAARSVAESS